MPPTRIPSPARSQGATATPRRQKPRAFRSMSSPARSNSSVKLTTMIPMGSFVLSPMPSRRSVLTDTTDMDIPRRKSWWKKLDESSREIMEVLNNKESAEANNAIEEYIEVDVLSQEKKNYTLDIPESSDGESISSIIIPQRKLFTQKESKPQKKFAEIIDNRESLAKLYKTQGDNDKTLNIGRKNLFSQTRQRNKPLFPTALLNISANKTIQNKTKELITTNAQGQVKSLFGNRPGAKRKNMFADFIVSDSEDEIPEIKPKVFEFHKRDEQKRRQNLNSRRGRESCLTSPTSSITDIEMDDWRLLPSSTMVDHQLEDGLRTTPSKRARLNKLTEVIESINTESNTPNKTKQSNKSLHSKSKFTNVSQSKEMEANELIASKPDNLEIDTVKDKNKSTTKRSLREQTFRNEEHNKYENASLVKTVNEDVSTKFNTAKNTEISKYSKNSKILSKIDQVLQSDDDDDDNENFTLVYENDDNNELENEKIEIISRSETKDAKTNSKISKHNVSENVSGAKQLQNKSKLQNITHHVSQIDNEDPSNEKDKPHKSRQSAIHSTSVNKNQKESPKLNNNKIEIKNTLKIDQIVNNGEISSKNDEIAYYDKEDIQVLSNLDRTVGHETRAERNSHYKDVNNKESDDNTHYVRKQNEQDVANDRNSAIEEVDAYNNVMPEEQIGNIEDQEKQGTIDNEPNVNQGSRNNSEEDIEDHCEEENEHYEQFTNEKTKEFDNHKDKEKTPNVLKITKKEIKNYKEYKVDNETKLDENLGNDNQQYKDITQCERRNAEVQHYDIVQNEVENHIINNENITNNKDHFDKKDAKNETLKNVQLNTTHDKTCKHRQEHDSKLATPEVILWEKPSQKGSFIVQRRHTSIRKTKSIINNITIGPSLESLRKSSISNESRNSSAEGSGWDSHRTTRATLRQTFGKDFTPRKSLRALVMEKSAHRKTNFTEISCFPQANSTELPGRLLHHINDSNVAQKGIESDDELTQGYSDDVHKIHVNHQKMSHDIGEINNAQNIHNINHDLSHDKHGADIPQQITESDDAHEMDNSDREILRDVDDSDNVQTNNESNDAHEMDNSNREMLRDVDDSDNIQTNNESNDAHEMNESYLETSCEMDGAEKSQSTNKSEQENEMNVSDDAQKNNESNEENEIDESDDTHEVTDREVSRELDDDNDEEENNDSDISHEINNSDDIQEMTEQDMSRELDDADDSQEMSGQQASREFDEDVQIEELEEMSESELVERINETHESRHHDAQDINKSNETQEMDEPEDPHEIINSNHEESRQKRQTTLELYLQKIKKQNIERKKRLEEEIRTTIKPPTRDMLNPFKVPAVPKQRRMKTQQIKPKAKPFKSSIMLPAEVLEDMKYKPPKRYRPTNASWVTKRLYNFLEAKLEPRYDYKARVRSEKLVETIYNFTKDIRRHGTAPTHAVDALKHEMARLEIVQTHFEFYEFFHEYMPREVRVKVVPDVFNKISLPKHGIFSDILR